MKNSLSPDLIRFVVDISDCHMLYNFLKLRFAPTLDWYWARLFHEFTKLRAEADDNRNVNVTQEEWLERWWLLHSEVKRYDVLNRRKATFDAEIRRFYWDFRGEIEGGRSKKSLDEYVQDFDLQVYSTLTACRETSFVQGKE